jgi:hypothetical protein
MSACGRPAAQVPSPHPRNVDIYGAEPHADMEALVIKGLV